MSALRPLPRRPVSRRSRLRQSLLRRPLPSTLLGRLALVTGAMLVVAVSLLIWQEHVRLRAQIEHGERARIEAIAGTLALALDAADHQRAAATAVAPLNGWETAAPSVLAQHRHLTAAAARNQLMAGVTTLSLDPGLARRVRLAPEQPSVKALRVVASSDLIPSRITRYDYVPQMAPAFFEGLPASRGAHRDAHGTWITAWGPIVGEQQKVVGVVQVEASLDTLLDAARKHLYQQMLFALLVLVGVMSVIVFVNARLTRYLSELGTAAREFGRGNLLMPIEARAGASAEVRELAETLEGARREIAKRVEAQSKTEAELEAAVDRAEELARVKSRFSATMSHELRTPLNAILGYTEMLLEEAPPSMAPDLGRIRDAGALLLELIDDVLDLAKLEAGKMELVREEFDVATLLRSTAETVMPLAAKKGNRLSVTTPPDGLSMRGDSNRLRQVLLNLLGNAAKFTEEGEISIEAEAQQTEGHDARVVFRVRDTGIGISGEHLGRLFRPFTQADATTTRKYGGTGLGLSLSRELVVRMGGRIYAESREGEGSTFIVDLPRDAH